MKKRIISMLLTVLMIMSLFSGLSINAYAAQYNGANVIDYTMQQGDFVLRICQRLGLNYYTCKNAIMILNNIYDGQWNKLTVGRTLLLPASDYDAVLIANGAGTTANTSGAAATTATTGSLTGTASTGTATATTANANASSADVLGYYIVPYTMSYGETVSGVCNSLGVNFSIFGPFIKQLNNVSSWNKVRAGDTIVIPTPYAPSVGTTCYGVMEHIVTNSDTAYGIVTSKGLNYNANERVLKVLNQTDNLAAVKAGQKFFYAVPLTVSVPGTGNPGSTATTTTTTTVTDANGTTTTQTTTTSKLYALSSGMSASDGTMLFYMNSKPVTAAPAGAKVTVVTSTNSGKAIQGLTVKHADGKADLMLTADTFTMPSCDVRVDATVKTGHNINISANYSGKASASVGGISVQSAVKGATVVIKSADPNYQISAVYAYYKKLISASTKDALTVSSSNAFIMPDADVDVEVVLKPVTTYAFYVNEPARGSFYLEVNGSPVTRAAKGAQVTVVAQAQDGYEPKSLTIKTTPGGKTVNVFSNTFTMPASDVEVEVKFATKGNNIVIMPSQVATVLAYVKDEIVDEAGAGETVELKAITNPDDMENDPFTPALLSDADYSIKYDVVRNSDGLKVKVDDAAHTFSMPKGGVTVTPIITAKDKAVVKGQIIINNGTPVTTYSNASFSVSYTSAGKEKRTEFTGKNDKDAQIPSLEYVDLRYDSAEGVSFVKYDVTVKNSTDDAEMSELLSNEANLRGYFQIPAPKGGDAVEITIQAHFETGKVPIGPAAVVAGNGTVSYRLQKAADLPMNITNLDEVYSSLLASLGTSINSAEPGDTVYIIAAPANGYKFDDDKYDTKLVVTRKDNGARVPLTKVGPVMTAGSGTIWGYQYSFTMPAEGVDVSVAFDAKPFRLFMKTVDETEKDLSGEGLWQIAVNMEPGIVDNSWLGKYIGTVVEVEYGDYVTVAMTEAGWSKYDMVSFRIDGKEYTADVLNHFYNFQMIDDRAKDLEIVAVMRPKVPYSVGIHSLYATYVDTTKGAAQFVILDSPSGYSDEFRFNGLQRLNYVNRAVTGDKVAVVVSSIDNKYSVKASDITLYTLGSDADRIILKEEWVDEFGKTVAAGTGIRVFTFTMPDSDVYIGVNFAGTKHPLVISVWDEKGLPLSNMVQVITNNATNPVSYDVGADFTFDDMPYNTQVSVMRSTQALAEGKIINKVDVWTADHKSVPYTSLTAAGEGIYFAMPDEPVWVNVIVTDNSYNLPVNALYQVNNGSLSFRKSDNPNDPVYSLSDFKKGETVYVHAAPNSGYKQLEVGELKVLANGATNIATYVTNGVWSFTMPEGTIIFQADFVSKEAVERTIKFNLVDKDGNAVTDGKITATAGSNSGAYGNGATLRVLEGQNVTFANNSVSIIRIESKSGKGISGNSYTVPTGLAANDIWDEITVTVSAKANTTAQVTITSPDGNVTISSAALSGSFNKGESKTFTLDVGSTITVTSATANADKVTLTTNHSNSGVSGNSYKVPDLASDELTIHLGYSGNPINKDVGAHGSVALFSDAAMTTPFNATSANPGTVIYVKAAPDTGYAQNSLEVKGVASNASVLEGGDHFTMPAGGVNVKATFKANDVKMEVVFTKDGKPVTDSSIKIKVNDVENTYSNTVKNLEAKTGQTISVIAGSVTGSYKLKGVKVYLGASDKTGTEFKDTTQRTLTGTETKLEIILDSATATTSATNAYSAAPAEPEVTEEEAAGGEDAQLAENVAEDTADEAEDSVPEDEGAALDNEVEDNVDEAAGEAVSEAAGEAVDKAAESGEQA